MQKPERSGPGGRHGRAGRRWSSLDPSGPGCHSPAPGHPGSRHSHGRPEPGRAAVRAGPPVPVPTQTRSARNDIRQRSPANPRPGPEHKAPVLHAQDAGDAEFAEPGRQRLRSAFACSLNPPANARRSSSAGPAGNAAEQPDLFGSRAARCRAQSRAYRLQRRSRRPRLRGAPVIGPDRQPGSGRLARRKSKGRSPNGSEVEGSVLACRRTRVRWSSRVSLSRSGFRLLRAGISSLLRFRPRLPRPHACGGLRATTAEVIAHTRVTSRPSAHTSADPVKAPGRGVGLSTLSGGVGREFDDEVSVEGCTDSL